MKRALLFSIMFFAGMAAFAEATHLWVSGANVRIRSAGNTSGQVVATLPLGTWAEIIETGAEKQNLLGSSEYWYKIRDENNNEGWIFGGLTLRCSLVEKYSVAANLVRTRYERFGRPIEEAEQLYSFTKKLVKEATNNEDLAKAELAKLQSLQLILNTLSAMMKGSDESHAAIKENRDKIYYHESAGQFYISPDVFWKLAQKHAKTSMADDISWEAARQQLPGESEGDPTVILGMLSLSEVEYLKSFPSGKYVSQALETIKYSLEEMPTTLKGYFNNEYADSRNSFLEQLNELKEAVKNCKGNKAGILELVESVKKAAMN
jgi:hypothetical protein